MLKVSELIKILQNIKDSDMPVEFYSYEWTDDLKEQEYQLRQFEDIEKCEGAIKIYLDK